MTRLTLDVPEPELRDLRAAFNATFDREEQGDLAALRGNSAFDEWVFRRAIVPLILEVNYDTDRSEVDMSAVEVADDGTIIYNQDKDNDESGPQSE